MPKKKYQEPIKAITICGVGMGSSLILRMTAEKAFKELGVDAKVEATDVGSARSMGADIIIGQSMHTEDFQGVAPIVIAINNFTNVNALKEKLKVALEEKGWLKND